MPWCEPLWVHLVWDSLYFLDLCICFLHKVREVFYHYFFNRFKFLVLLSFQHHHDANVGMLEVLPEALYTILIFLHCWWECRLVRPLWKTVWNFLRKLKMELPFDPAIPLLQLYPKNPETPIQKNLCTPMFIAAQFTIAKYFCCSDWVFSASLPSKSLI